MNKDTWEKIGAALLVLLAVLAIWEFFRNDRNELISARGKQVLGDNDLMKRVNDEVERHKDQNISGPVVVKLG